MIAKRSFYKSLLLLVAFAALACNEIYTPDITVPTDILFLEGGVTNAQGPYTIKLKNAVEFTGKEVFKPISGAAVFMLENNQNQVWFNEIEKGIYQTDSLYTATVSNTYQLFIEMPGGEVYQSTTQKIPPQNVDILSVYGEKKAVKLKYYNVYNELIVKEKEVSQLYADISGAEEDVYLRFNYKTILEHSGYYKFRLHPETPVYRIPLYMYDAFYKNDLTITKISKEIDRLNGLDLTYVEDKESYNDLKYKYIPEIEEDCPNDTIIIKSYDEFIQDTVIDTTIYESFNGLFDKEYFLGWITEIYQYSINQEVYTFWSDVKKLEETKGEIFDPMATQLRGNMSCSTDPNKIMGGVFEVANKKVSKSFVNYKPDGDIYYGQLINSSFQYPDLFWQDSIPPDNWIEVIK